MTAEPITAHPCYARCFRIYRNALSDWNASGSIQSAAATLGMDRRAYCDARLSANQCQWYSVGTPEPFTQRHAEVAWMAAVEATTLTHPQQEKEVEQHGDPDS